MMIHKHLTRAQGSLDRLVNAAKEPGVWRMSWQRAAAQDVRRVLQYPALYADLTETPSGWFPFGHHPRTEHDPALEYAGRDRNGDPLWERPTERKTT